VGLGGGGGKGGEGSPKRHTAPIAIRAHRILKARTPSLSLHLQQSIDNLFCECNARLALEVSSAYGRPFSLAGCSR
jgi:hypothetical protein